MEPARWRRITGIYHATIARPPEERASFLGQVCHGDEGIRKRVEAMVKSHETSGDFIESPAFAVAPELLIDEPAGDLIGQLIGHYRIESLIGIGGMGEVYLARDEQLGRKVALKLLPEHMTADKTQLSRFKTEARAASALNHPNILTVYEIGTEGNRQFIATEFIEGITLRAALARGRMTLHDALEIAVQVASALAAAHETGVVHRDIKPENIMLRPDGYAKVLDFGIAKLTEQHPGSDLHEVGTTTLQTQPGLLLGTAHYMSPEQTRGQKVDARSDIWSLGVVIYEMVGGVPPFSGETPSDCIASILTTEPPPLSGGLSDIPVKLQSIVQKALRKNSDERYRTTKEMLADLRDLKGELEAGGSSPQTKARAEPIVSKIKRHKRGILVALVGAVLAAAALAYHFYFVTPAPSPNEKSIAVLPFADLSQARDQEYFCDGIQEEILTRLSKIADLKVISRTSTQRFKSAPKNLPEIAKQLGVASILEGTVQKAGDQIRVHVQLINAGNDSHLWAEKYDRKLTDVFGVESEIAKAIAENLAAKLTHTEERAVSAKPTNNPAAYELYLQGRYFWNRRDREGFRRAIELFTKATELDPNYALAYAGIADTYALLPMYGFAPARDSYPKAKAAALKALQLDDTLAEAHASYGNVLLSDFDWVRSRRELERAIELNPNYSTAHQWLGSDNLMNSGELDRGLAEVRRARELDPLSPIVNTILGIAYYLRREYADAVTQFHKTFEIDPNFLLAHVMLGQTLVMQGAIDEGIAEAQKARQINGDVGVLSILGYAYARKGDREQALKILDQLKAESQKEFVPAVDFAFLYIGLGDKEQALDWLKKGYEDRSSGTIKVDPVCDPLHGDPRYERLVAKVFGSAENKSPVPPIDNKSIAVLPFANLSSEPETTYFADGIQEEILTRLSKIRDLKVISRTSTQRFKSAPKNLPEIAKQLGVANILEGTVQKADNQVRVHVQLISARNDSHLWAEKYDRKLTDIFGVESEIAKAIADTLQAKLTGSEQRAIATRPTENPEAHQLYLKGTFFSNKRTGPDLRTAIDYFKDAIGKDPNYALAYAGLADAYALVSLYGGEGPRETVPQAKAAARKALELEDTLPEAHNSLGLVLALYDFDFAQSKKEFERAIELDPNYATAHHQFGNVNLAMTGEFDRAIAEANRALELDPLSLIINADLGQDFMLARRYDQAIDQLRKTLAMDPRFYYARWTLGECLQMKGQLGEAMAEYQKAADITDDPMVVALLAQGYAKTGQRDKAWELLSQLEQLARRRYVGPFTFALVHLALGEKEKAIDDLERAYRERADPGIVGIKVEPLLDPLRGEPRFERLVAKVAGAVESR